MTAASWRDSDGRVVIDEDRIRHRWQLGQCVCCGGAMHQPRAIAEGVLLCGHCARRNHLNRPGELAAVLKALASR